MLLLAAASTSAPAFAQNQAQNQLAPESRATLLATERARQGRVRVALLFAGVDRRTLMLPRAFVSRAPRVFCSFYGSVTIG